MEPTPNMLLRLAIVRSGFTQRAVAQRARVPETRFSAITRGRIVPSEAEQKRIASALKADLHDLFPAQAAVAS